MLAIDNSSIDVIEDSEQKPHDSVIGWQGLRCILPPEWNVTGFSMERDAGYLRIDAPINQALTVQIRWSNAASPYQGPPNLYSVLMPHYRKWRKIPEPKVQRPDLKQNLDKILKDSAKQARKGKAAFDSTVKPERTEGENGERSSINFSWIGAGRGQGKIWYCSECHRIVIAQVIGMAKDQALIASVASRLFATLKDHSVEGFDLWALYDLQMEVPDDFRLESQKLLSGHLQLIFHRGAERIVLDRWGLANMTLKRFTVDEWLKVNSLVNLKKISPETATAGTDHEVTRYSGPLRLSGSIKALREARGSLRRFPGTYTGSVWQCEESNKLFGLQILANRRSGALWDEVAKRCVCH